MIEEQNPWSLNNIIEFDKKECKYFYRWWFSKLRFEAVSIIDLKERKIIKKKQFENSKEIFT